MTIVVDVLFIILCVAIMAIIMSQHRKSGGFTGAFGGGGTQMDMTQGSWQRMTTMTKITVAVTAVFLVASLVVVKFKLY
jgi:preprotein translocase subunit SecG